MSKKLLVKDITNNFGDRFENEMSIYEDGTYQCNGWRIDDFSEWKLIDGHFAHKHEGEHKFSCNKDDQTLRLGRVVLDAISQNFEEVVLKDE